jgi:hypothetical protein
VNDAIVRPVGDFAFAAAVLEDKMEAQAYWRREFGKDLRRIRDHVMVDIAKAFIMVLGWPFSKPRLETTPMLNLWWFKTSTVYYGV